MFIFKCLTGILRNVLDDLSFLGSWNLSLKGIVKNASLFLLTHTCEQCAQNLVTPRTYILQRLWNIVKKNNCLQNAVEFKICIYLVEVMYNYDATFFVVL